MEEAIQQPNLWDNPDIAAALLKTREHLLQEKALCDTLAEEFDFHYTLWSMAQEEQDLGLLAEEEKQLIRLHQTALRRRIEALFDQEEDRSSCFLSIQAGAGGTEAQDWALMLLRMYTRWAEQHGYSLGLVDETPGEEAGIKSATLNIRGPANSFPYGWLKGESGVHRLVRISPFDAAARRHTSFASVLVVPEVGEDIDIDIRDQDLRIDTYRASGAGGQHVNKTDSAVRITHLPTKLVVQCQQDRSQHRNRAIAMALLKSRLYEQEMHKRKEAMESRQEKHGISWGHQIRSYVLQPYQLVKDLRTGLEQGNPTAVLDGQIDTFLEAFLIQKAEASPA